MDVYDALTAPVVRYDFGQNPSRECEICKLHRPVIHETNGGCSFVRNTYKVPFYEKVCGSEITTPNIGGGVYDMVFGDRSGYKIPLFLNRDLDPKNPVTLLDAIIVSEPNNPSIGPSSFKCGDCDGTTPSLESGEMSNFCGDVKTNYLRWWYRNTPQYLRDVFGKPCLGVDSNGNTVTHQYVFRPCCGSQPDPFFCPGCGIGDQCQVQNTPETDQLISARLGAEGECNVCECSGNSCGPNKQFATCGPPVLIESTQCCEVFAGSNNQTGCINCGGLGQIGGNEIPPPSCPNDPPCTPIYNWCNGEPLPNSLRCSCTPSSLLKTIKVTINNQEIYLPILCNSNCDDFEIVE